MEHETLEEGSLMRHNNVASTLEAHLSGEVLTDARGGMLNEKYPQPGDIVNGFYTRESDLVRTPLNSNPAVTKGEICIYPNLRVNIYRTISHSTN